MVAVIEPALRAGLMAGLRGPHTAAATGVTTRVGAIGVSPITGRANRKQASTEPAGLLAERMIHSVGAQGSDWTIAPNRGTRDGDWLGRRSPGRSRGPGGQDRALTRTNLVQRTSPATAGARGRCPTCGRADAPTRSLEPRGAGSHSAHRHHPLFLIGKTQTGPSGRDVSRITHFHARANNLWFMLCRRGEPLRGPGLLVLFESKCRLRGIVPDSSQLFSDQLREWNRQAWATQLAPTMRAAPDYDVVWRDWTSIRATIF